MEAANAELEALKAENESASDQTAAQLQLTQDALAAMTSERDELQAAVEASAAQMAEFQALQDSLAAITAERDALQLAAENAKIGKTSAVILDAEENIIQEYDSIADLKLDELKLDAGVYTIRMIVYTAAGEEAARYDLPYISVGTAEEEAAAEPATEEPAEEAAEPVQEDASEEPVEETPAEEASEEAAEETSEEAADVTEEEAEGDAA